MKRQWQQEELLHEWTIHLEDRLLLENKSGANRLGCALLLKYFQRSGRFPQHKHEIPSNVISHIAAQVGVPAADYLQYDWAGRSIKEHRAQIRTVLKFREATVAI